jgi:hypothetical protein
MDKIIYKGAVNSLSFGNVSYNLLKEMYKKELSIAFFPISDNVDLNAFDKADEDFKNWIVSSAKNRFHVLDKEDACLSQWHLNGSESRLSSNTTLFTFYETDQPTLVEQKIVDMQTKVAFASQHAYEVFKNAGCSNVYHVPIGFDEDFQESDDSYLPDKIHFGLMGKFEKRKNTAQIIKNWAKKYGNNFKYQLSCCITNPFFKPEQMNQIINQTLEGQVYGNINFIPHLKTNSEVNEFINAIDIDLSGLSGAEGWNLPAFNATALGKWSVVMDHTSHKDWANDKNCILVDPELKVDIYDGTFFIQGHPFNQGSMNQISDESMIEAFEKSEKFARKKNKEGVKLKSNFTYENTLNKLMEIMENER